MLRVPGSTLSHDEARRFYDRFGAWQDKQAFYERSALERLISRAAFADAHRVVEFGCGTGRLAAELLSQHLPPECRYLGLDLSGTMVNLARTRVAAFGARAQIRQTDGSPSLELDNESCDRFLSTYVLDLLAENEIHVLLAEARRVLVPGGLVAVASLTRGQKAAERAVSWILERIHAIRPALVGGCRPMELATLLNDGGWKIRYRCVVSSFAIPSEILIAERA